MICCEDSFSVASVVGWINNDGGDLLMEDKSAKNKQALPIPTIMAVGQGPTAILNGRTIFFVTIDVAQLRSLGRRRNNGGPASSQKMITPIILQRGLPPVL
jgi:hypothetical protein